LVTDRSGGWAWLFGRRGVQSNFYGPEEVVRAQWAYAKKRMADIPGAQFVDGPFYKFPLTDEQIPMLRDEQDFGIPTLSTFSIGVRSQFGTATKGHVGFSPVIPMTGEAVIESQRVFETILQEYGRDVAVNVFPLVSPPNVRDPHHVQRDARRGGQPPHSRRL